MARYNEILVGRYNRFIQKLLSMKGPATMPQAAGEMQPVMPFFNGAENRYLEGWNRFGAVTTTPAVAANFGGMRIRNPGTSNVIAVIEKITFSSVVADQPRVQVGLSTTDYGTAVTSTRLDPRGGTNTSLILTSTGSGAGLGSTVMFSTTPANGFYDFIGTDIQELPLLPGDTYNVLAGTVNQAVTFAIMWRERFLEDSERA